MPLQNCLTLLVLLETTSNISLPRSIFTCERVLQGYVAKDIQSLYQYLIKMKDVFKELKVLVEKGKVVPHKLTKVYWKQQFLQVQASFNITILVTALRVNTWAPFAEETSIFISIFLLPRVDPFLREWISYGGKRTSANPAGVAAIRLDLVWRTSWGVLARGESVCLVDYSAGVFLSRMCLPVVVHLVKDNGPLGVRYGRIYR